MKHAPERQQINVTGRRQGVTLVEVLMSLMIMSIGVASVAALFPISVLRTVQANQLTNAAVVKYNVEAMIEADPSWVTDPDQDGNLIEHFRAPAERNYVVDPIGFYTHFADGAFAVAASFGNIGGTPAPFVRRWGGGLGTLPEVSLGGSFRVADPPVAPPDPKYATALRLAAISIAGQGDGWTTDVDAVPASLITSPDGVIGVQLPTGTDFDLTQMGTSRQTLSSLVQTPISIPPNYLIQDPELFRVVVFSSDGKRSQAYPLTHIDISTNQVYWSEDIDGDGTGDNDFNMSGSRNALTDIRPLPAEFGGNVSRVLLQSRKLSDFAWLLTVRRRSDGFVRGVDVVVRYKNGADITDERLFEATFIKGTNIVGLRYPSPGNGPSIRKGKFIFDAVNALWYRIQDYKEKPAVGSALLWDHPNYDAVIFTETQIQEAAGEDQFHQFNSSGTSILLNGVIDPGQFNASGILQQPFTVSGGVPTALSEDEARPGDGDSVLDFGAAMLPAGVIEVYPMGSTPLPSGL